MKAGGINTVSTYVFWIHHEEEQGKFDWSGQRSLRDFLRLARKRGLKVIVRMGPWCHGEVRNGGFPDWVQNSGTQLRKNDPAFLELVEPLYAQEAEQMQGLLWKDGGPVIGVQFDNECDHADYLLALKEMARAAGVDVPFYTITGWQGGLPNKELIPLFGGYADGFWGGSREDYRKEFLFTDVRAMNDLGAQLTEQKPGQQRLDRTVSLRLRRDRRRHDVGLRPPHQDRSRPTIRPRWRWPSSAAATTCRAIICTRAA